jgi:radical SAM protein with 4Fe4S-binding SPASM domain
MRTLRQWWDELNGKGLKPGVYKYDGKDELAHHRFHLRVDSAQKGVLLVDASSLIFLNGTAMDYVRSALEDRDDDQMVKYMIRKYKKLDRSKAVQDYSHIKEQLVRFIHGDQEVLNTIGSDKLTFGSDDFPAPYRMDLILTYGCQNKCEHCYNEPRQLTELTVEQWKEVISKLWKIGVPHVVFTGGEPTLYPGLMDLIARSEEFGQVTGLVTNGRKLREPGFLKELIAKGLDHVQITVLSHREDIHDGLVGEKGAWRETLEGLKIAVSEDVYLTTNTTIMRSNSMEIEDTMRFLISLGVKHIAFNGIIRSGGGKDTEGIDYQEMSSILGRLKRISEETGIKMIWYTPTPYCEFNPISSGFGIKQCTACSLNMAIEPDGAVLPCQSYYKSVGNILTDDWQKIWNHDLCKSIRERKFLDGKCLDCDMMDTCGGGCPLSREHGDYICMDRHSTV